MSADDHGSASTYRNWSCRCDACRAANSAVVALQRQRRRSEVPEGRDDIPHGSNSTYTNYFCRCAPCKESHRVVRRRYRTTRTAS